MRVERQKWRENGVADFGGFGIIRKAALYEGFGPGTVEKFRELWKSAGGAELGKPILTKKEERTRFDG
jgi:hypothetical protein